MPAPEPAGESSTSATKKAMSTGANGATNYELPWSVCLVCLVTTLLTVN
jgi:hypothetical protein